MEDGKEPCKEISPVRRRDFRKMDSHREEGRRRPVVLVRVVEPVRVELEQVVEVEDRRVLPLALGLEPIVFIHLVSPPHRS